MAGRSERKVPEMKRSEGANGINAAATQQADGSSTAAADLLPESAEMVAAQHMERDAGDAGRSTADGVAGKLDGRTSSATEAAERDQDPARTGSGNRQQRPATGASPQAAAKHGKGQRTLQSFFTSKPST